MGNQQKAAQKVSENQSIDLALTLKYKNFLSSPPQSRYNHLRTLIPLISQNLQKLSKIYQKINKLLLFKILIKSLIAKVMKYSLDPLRNQTALKSFITVAKTSRYLLLSILKLFLNKLINSKKLHWLRKNLNHLNQILTYLNLHLILKLHYLFKNLRSKVLSTHLLQSQNLRLIQWLLTRKKISSLLFQQPLSSFPPLEFKQTKLLKL